MASVFLFCALPASSSPGFTAHSPWSQHTWQALDLVFPSLDDVLHAASLQPNAARYKPLPNTRHKIQAPQALGLKPGAGV